METRSPVFDAVVVGGGPAGCAASIACAQRGLKVALVEGKRFPRDRPGETLHPGVEQPLRQLGVLEPVLASNFPRHLGTVTSWNSPARFVPFGNDEQGPWRGFQAWRATFDSLLLEKARQDGVEIHQPCQALEPLIEGARVGGVLTSDGPLKAPFTIDASGGQQWLARRLALPRRRCSSRLIARYGYARGNCPSHDEAPSIVADDSGWTWIAKVRPNLYQWTRLSYLGPAASRDWVPETLAPLAREGSTRFADVTWRMLHAPADRGYFVVGDAAACLDPSSSHGVLKALLTGIMAAHLIAAIRRDPACERCSRQHYSDWLSQWFEADMSALKQLFSQLPTGSTWVE